MRASLSIASVLTITIFFGFQSIAKSFFIATSANTFSNLDERVLRICSAASSSKQLAALVIEFNMQSTIDPFFCSSASYLCLVQHDGIKKSSLV